MNRLRVPLFFGSTVALIAAGYACSSSSGNGSGPPLNEAGPDQVSGSSSGGGSSSGSSSSGSVGEGGPAPTCSSPSRDGRLRHVGRHAGASPQAARAPAPRQREHHPRLPAHRLVHALAGALRGTPLPANTNADVHPVHGRDPRWIPPRTPSSTCTTSAAVKPDFGISALFTSSCAGLGAPPAGIGQLNGPIQAYTFIVPTAEFASQTSISATEAYYAFGDGAEQPRHAQRCGGVERPDAVLAAPRDQEHARFDRATTSG